MVVDEGSSVTAERDAVTVENEALALSFCGIFGDDAALAPTRTNRNTTIAMATIQNPGKAILPEAPD